MPAFFLPLSQKLDKRIGENAFTLAEAALVQLKEYEALLKQRADTSMELVKLIYEREADPNFEKAKLLSEKIVLYYRGI